MAWDCNYLLQSVRLLSSHLETLVLTSKYQSLPLIKTHLTALFREMFFTDNPSCLNSSYSLAW